MLVPQPRQLLRHLAQVVAHGFRVETPPHDREGRCWVGAGRVILGRPSCHRGQRRTIGAAGAAWPQAATAGGMPLTSPPRLFKICSASSTELTPITFSELPLASCSASFSCFFGTRK